MVVFCPISPDFTTCSVAFHKHLVGVIVKRLSNFASLALRILALMLFYSHKTLQNEIVCFLSMTSLCISIFYNYFPRHLMVVFIRFLHKQVHDLIYSKVSAVEKFFWRVINEKNSIFSFFREGTVYFWMLSSQKAWKCDFFCTNRWSTVQLSSLVPYFVPKFFSASFSQKTEFFEYFWNRLDIPHCPLRVSNLTLIFCKYICRIRLIFP